MTRKLICMNSKKMNGSPLRLVLLHCLLFPRLHRLLLPPHLKDLSDNRLLVLMNVFLLCVLKDCQKAEMLWNIGLTIALTFLLSIPQYLKIKYQLRVLLQLRLSAAAPALPKEPRICHIILLAGCYQHSQSLASCYRV